jgi:hypothetical protein
MEQARNDGFHINSHMDDEGITSVIKQGLSTMMMYLHTIFSMLLIMLPMLKRDTNYGFHELFRF